MLDQGKVSLNIIMLWQYRILKVSLAIIIIISIVMLTMVIFEGAQKLDDVEEIGMIAFAGLITLEKFSYNTVVFLMIFEWFTITNVINFEHKL